MTHLIFDMDGTIIDSMPVHRYSWLEFARRHGLLRQAEELERATNGRTGIEGMRALFGQDLPLAQAQAYVHEKESLYRDRFASQFRWITGFQNFAQQALGRGLRCGLGTAGDRHNIRFALQHLPSPELDDLFEVCVGGDEGLAGKPEPDIFLAVAERMRVQPADCLVFEDSPAGIESARRAGMRAVALLTSYSADDLAGPHVVAAVPHYDALLALPACPF